MVVSELLRQWLRRPRRTTIRECRRCGTTIETTDEPCPTCGSTEVAVYELR